jgi:3-oxoacyl-[acyl-carrier-protein] synthase II
MLREPIVITGAGILACNGIGRKAYWNALKAGKSGIRQVDRFDTSQLPCRIAGQLWDFDPQDFMKSSDVRNWHRHVHQAVACSRLAVDDADLKAAGYQPERLAVGFGTSVGSPNEAYQAQQEAFESHGFKKVSKLASSAFSGHAATIHVTIDFGLRGPAITIASGCATGLDVLAWGRDQIRMGRADAAIVGATESPIFPMSFATACSLGILSKRNDAPDKAMRPFERNRDGIVLSEGAGAVVLERKGHAAARGAQILGEIAGFGSAAEAGNPLILDRKGVALSRAVTEALADAHVTPCDIDHIQSHGVSLEMYDRCETNAYKRVFGKDAYRIPISAIKSMTGQAYAAGGLLGAVAALLALHEEVIAPTLNLDVPDPACDLDFVSLKYRLGDVRTALVAAMSFGGTHSAVVLKQVA